MSRAQAKAQEQARALQAAADANPALLQDRLWMEDWERTQSDLERLGGDAAALRGRIPADHPALYGHGDIDIPDLPTPDESAKRAEDGDTLIQRGRLLNQLGRKSGSFATQAAGMLDAARGAREKEAATRAYREAQTSAKVKERRAQGEATYQDLLPRLGRPEYASLSPDFKGSWSARVKSGELNWNAAMNALEAERQRGPEAAASKAITQEKAQQEALAATGQETGEEQRQRVAAEKQARDKGHAEEVNRRADEDAVKRFEAEMDRTEDDPDALPGLGGKRPAQPRLDRLTVVDAKRILRMQNASPSVRALAQRRMDEARKTGEYVDQPSGAYGTGAAPARESSEQPNEARQAAAAEFAGLPADQQTGPKWAEIKRKHGL